jgi:hypothetical protein
MPESPSAGDLDAALTFVAVAALSTAWAHFLYEAKMMSDGGKLQTRRTRPCAIETYRTADKHTACDAERARALHTFMPRRERMLICFEAPGTKRESSFSFMAIWDRGGFREAPEAAARDRNS